MALRRADRERLATMTGPQRAVHVADRTRPLNWSDWSAVPKWPAPKLTEGAKPVTATMLPDFWAVRLYDDTLKEVFRGRTDKDIAPDLALAPVLGAVDDPNEKSDPRDDELTTFLKDQNLRWATDFKAALEAGMAFTHQLAKPLPRLGAILVAGVRRGDPVDMAAEMELALRGHWFTGGLDILPQGTATNHADEAAPPPTKEGEDIDLLFDLHGRDRSKAALLRAKALDADPANLTRLPAADALSVGLGTIFGNRLDHTAHADAPEGLEQAAMNTIVGQGLGRYYASRVLTHLGGEAPLAGAWDTTLGHHANWVRPGGPLPAIRVGGQPYGILPVQGRLSPELARDEADKHLILTVLSLFPHWTDAEPPATLDPDATDGRPTTTAAATIASLLEVLGHVPHLRDLQVRPLTNHADEDIVTLRGLFDRLHALFARPDVQKGTSWEADLMSFRARMTGEDNALANAGNAPPIGVQQAIADEMDLWLYNPAPPFPGGAIGPNHRNEALAIHKDLVTLLNDYRAAIDAMPAILRPHFDRGGLSAAPPAVTKPAGLMNFAASTYDPEAVPLGHAVAPGGDLSAVQKVLSTALNALDNPPPAAQRKPLTDPEAPLLAHLVDLAWRMVPTKASVAVLQAVLKALATRVDTIAEMDADAPLRASEIDSLDRLTRAALGPLSYRLDAWVTSFATRRLAQMRAQTPRGVTLGGYGWLLDLAPTQEPVSDGYIHAPSVGQAVTAAVLNGGWKAYGTADGTAPLAVDLTSDRVRGAEWILDGVRNGQDMADLLGARLERSLHDDALPLDAFIDDIRRLANAGRGLPDPAARIADGLAVARAFSAERSDAEEALRTDLLTLASPIAGTSAAARRNRRLRELFSVLAGDLDAVADLTMAQAVHGLAHGNATAAGAMLNMLGDQEGAVPPIDVIRTPRHGQMVTHRVAVLCAGTAPADALSLAEPALAGWLTAHLPAPADIGFVHTVIDTAGQTLTHRHTLAQTGIPAHAMPALAGRGTTQEAAPLGRLIAAWATARHGTGETRLSDAARRAQSVNEAGLIAAAASDAIRAARPLTCADMMVPGTEVPTAHLESAALTVRRAALRDRLMVLRGELSRSRDRIMAAATELATLRLAPALAAAMSLDDQSARATLTEAIDARIAALDAGGDDAQALRIGVGGAIRILPPVILSTGDPILTAPAPAQVLALEAEGRIWWDQIGHVSEGAGAMGLFLDLATPVGKQAEALALRQLPATADGWAAVTRPADAGERLCLFLASGGRALAPGPVAGLVCATLTEAIPAPHQTTGIAWHFDAPSARPPQVVLLSMVDESKTACDDQIFAQMLNTLELTKLRATGADRIVGLGHEAPALYLPDPPVSKELLE